MHSQAERLSGATILDGIARFEARGYTAQFGTRPGGAVACFACRRELPAHDLALDGTFRVEGASDPSSEAVVAALRCGACGAKGTLVLTYGPEAPAEDAEVLGVLGGEVVGRGPGA